MTRPILIGSLVTAIAVGAAISWTAVARDREYRRLLAVGEVAFADADTMLAIEAFSGAIALNRDSMVAHLRRGETYRRHGNLAAALRDLRTASQLDPAATRPLEQLGDAFYALQQYERAADRYAAFVQIDDRSPRLLYKLALARYRSGDAAGAVTPLRQAVQQHEGFAEAYYLLGISLRQQGQVNEALWALQRAVALDPAMPPAREALAGLFRTLGRHRERIGQLEALVELEPDAAARLGRAIDQRPDDDEAYATLASVWLRLAETRGDEVALAKALEATRSALARNLATGHSLAVHGRALLVSGDVARALPVLRSAASQLPVDPLVFERLATAAERAGQLGEARDALARYVSLVDDQRAHVAAASRLAAWSWQLKQPADAARWLERLWQLSEPDEAQALRLVEAHMASGAPERARQAVAAARARGVDTPALRRAEATVP